MSSPDQLRIDLAHALGFQSYPDLSTAEPYLNYIYNRNILAEEQEYIRLLVRAIEHFKANGTIQALFDQLVASESEEIFLETYPGSTARKENVTDIIMYIIGVRTMMLGSFVQLPTRARKIIQAYSAQRTGKDNPYEETLAALVRGSGLLPMVGVRDGLQPANDEDEVVRTARKLISLLSGGSLENLKGLSNSTILEKSDSNESGHPYHSLQDIDSIESLSVKATRLNVFTLNVLGAMDVSWTHDVSRHMLISQRRGRYVMEIFALPCVFDATSLAAKQTGISLELAQEIQESYGILFNAWPKLPTHAKIGRYFGLRRVCWCWSCSAHRYRSTIISQLRDGRNHTSRRKWRQKNSLRSEFDPQLIELMCNGEACDWTFELFPSLWIRIVALEDHLHRAKPWSIWVLLRDRRDTLQFWTFFFATLVLFLTFLQVALGIAQVIGSFE